MKPCLYTIIGIYALCHSKNYSYLLEEFVDYFVDQLPPSTPSDSGMIYYYSKFQ